MEGESRDQQIVGPRRAVDDPGRCRGSRGDRGEELGRGRCVARPDDERIVDQQHRPLGEELPAEMLDERLLELVDGHGLAERRRRFQGVDARVRERLHHPELLHGCAVDLLDLACEQLEDVESREDHRELVDGDTLRALEDVDADDVATHRADPCGHESERTGAVREPDAYEDMGLERLGHIRRVRVERRQVCCENVNADRSRSP